MNDCPDLQVWPGIHGEEGREEGEERRHSDLEILGKVKVH
jgi:hypothetical protein